MPDHSIFSKQDNGPLGRSTQRSTIISSRYATREAKKDKHLIDHRSGVALHSLNSGHGARCGSQGWWHACRDDKKARQTE